MPLSLQLARVDSSVSNLLSLHFLLRIDNLHCDRNHSSLTAVRCFDDDYWYVGKQPVAWEEYCAE